MTSSPPLLELRDRAVRFLAQRGASTESELLAHVYGGSPPSALHARLAAPLLSDPRLERRADGSWILRGREPTNEARPTGRAFTALALVATGPTPGRARLVRICALRIQDEEIVERFDATLKPGKRVPRYVAERVGVEPELLDAEPSFADILDPMEAFLDSHPILAQDVQLTWAFLDAEARRVGRVVVAPPLLDLNQLAVRHLQLKGKPSLGLVAAQLGIASNQLGQPDEEARVLGLVGSRLLALGGLSEASAGATTLRKGATARLLPDQPGVYVLRDRDQAPLYVGKARRLRSRMEAYVHRPLGPTRRLEGLVAAVTDVDTTECATDLDALILEDREIRRLQPQFNTVRQQRSPRYWIRLPLEPTSTKQAPRRLELSNGPTESNGGEFVGPFRNQALAQQARQLARDVFDLDRLRRMRAAGYAEQLARAWQWLNGEPLPPETRAYVASALLRQAVAFELAALLLPADPRHARYAVLRAGPTIIEGFLLDRALLRAWTTLERDDDMHAFAQRLLASSEARTGMDDVDVVLRWFGAQRPPARLVWLADDALSAADAIEDAVLDLASRET